MKERNFIEMLEAQWKRGNFICVGLDSEYEKLPVAMMFPVKEVAIYLFNRAIVDATKDLVCAYKPNLAFYEANGKAGYNALCRTITHIQRVAPDVPIILDAKRGDIGNTNRGYVNMAFDDLRADAITVNPYLGGEALEPFLDRADKGIFVLCRTSNSGAGEFQDLQVRRSDHLSYIHPENDRWEPMYLDVARRVATRWNKNKNCALVVGATCPDELKKIRRVVGDMPILIPGIGFQQKDVPLEKQIEQVVASGKNSRGCGIIISSSRDIIFASDRHDFAEAARRETIKLRDFINKYR